VPTAYFHFITSVSELIMNIYYRSFSNKAIEYIDVFLT